MRILTWNIGIGKGESDTPNSWRWDTLKKVIQEGEYDVVMLQEVPNRSFISCAQFGRPEIQGSLYSKEDWSKFWSKYNIHDSYRIQGGYGNLVTMTKKKIDARFLGFNKLPKHAVVFGLTITNNNITIANVHLHQTCDVRRKEQIDRLHNYNGKFENLNMLKTCIIGGDFNACSSEILGWSRDYKLPGDTRTSPIDHVMSRCHRKIEIIDVLYDNKPFTTTFSSKPGGSHYPLAVEIDF